MIHNTSKHMPKALCTECKAYYAGNDNIHLLTSVGRYELRIDLADFDDNTKYAKYDNFFVASAADKYRLVSIGAYTGDAGKSDAIHTEILKFSRLFISATVIELQ